MSEMQICNLHDVIILIKIVVALQTNLTTRHVQLHAAERLQCFERSQLLLDNCLVLCHRENESFSYLNSNT